MTDPQVEALAAALHEADGLQHYVELHPTADGDVDEVIQCFGNHGQDAEDVLVALSQSGWSLVRTEGLEARDRLLLAHLERFIRFDNGGPQYVTANGIRQDMPARLRADAIALRSAFLESQP